MEWTNHCFQTLIGKTPQMAFRWDDGFAFEMTDGTIHAFTLTADCCSESWLYSLEGFLFLIGHQITGFEEADTIDVNPDDGLGRQEVDTVYGYHFLTEGPFSHLGKFRLVFRNSSNGYYGGWVEIGEMPEVREPIREDWVYTKERTTSRT